ncbi:hypothetical protein G7067_09670 [Leucobacter insecticola]|uniref:Uncharacterized protein n=1 Tax=Leucobacter insecticola TaxID=2714934 RepID=A0A6G8FJT1_9MICO|nr:hypothetical protein [Leucobacter insecticola]QIM16614.1 hypothetical protein G7067_09670 [Leucobacter insecticola]
MEFTTGNEQLALVRALFPDLAETLDSALAERGQGAADRDDRGFDAWLDAEAASLRNGALAGAPFAALGDAESARFEAAFVSARSVALQGKLALPEPEAFAAAGVDLGRLARHLASDATLVPVPAPYGLGAERWGELFRNAAAQPGSPFGASDSLTFAAEVLDGFGILDSVPDPALARVETHSDEAVPLTWTLRLIPATPKPPLLGLGFAHGPHISLPEMLMLQLMRVTTGARPVDTESFTWLAGALAGGRLAARHVFDDSESLVRISCREIGNQGPHLGARPPVG